MIRPDAPQPLTLLEALIPVAAWSCWSRCPSSCSATPARAGPNQVALVFATMIAVFIGWRRGHTLDALREAAVASVGSGIGAIFILLAVGALIGTWAMSGTLVAMVYYGLQLLNPNYFYVTAGADLRRGRGEHRQLLDGRRHHRHRADGHRAEHGSQPGDHRRRDDLRRLFRRHDLAALRLGQSRRRRRRRRPLPAHPRDRC